jgi:hypothetical protein
VHFGQATFQEKYVGTQVQDVISQRLKYFISDFEENLNSRMFTILPADGAINTQMLKAFQHLTFTK